MVSFRDAIEASRAESKENNEGHIDDDDEEEDYIFVKSDVDD